MRYFLYCLSLVTLFTVQLACKKVKPEPPEASTLDTLLEPPLSVLYVPVQYRVSGFEELINAKVQGTFVNKWMALNEKGDSLHLEVSKMRRITLKREDRTLFIVVPIKISGKVRAKVAGIKIKNEAPVDAEINIHLATTLHMDTSWDLVSASRLQKIEWVNRIQPIAWNASVELYRITAGAAWSVKIYSPNKAVGKGKKTTVSSNKPFA